MKEISNKVKIGSYIIDVNSALSFLVFFCLTLCLFLFTYFSYMLLWRAEESIFRDNFKSTSNELSDKIVTVANRVVRDGLLLATVQGTFYPNEEDWPHAYINGFSPMASQLDSAFPPYGGVYMMPIVAPDQVESFESYAEASYSADPDLPNGAGSYDFGFGIFATNTSTGRKYHDVLGSSVYNSPNEFLTPVLAKVDYYDDSYLWNPHNDYPLVGMGMDDVYECVQARNKSCQMLSASDNSGDISGVLAISPIYPRNAPTTLVGFVVTAFVWNIILTGSVAQLASDMTLVVSTGDPTSDFTCGFRGDLVVIESAGDQHDRRFSHMGRESFFWLNDTDVPNSNKYRLTLYPTYEFYSRYHTALPVITTILSSFAIAVTVILFVVYDRYVKSDSQLQTKLLEGKRRFVRFISHEIRTPLNTAMIGLQLIEEQLVEQRMQDDASGTSSSDRSDQVMELVGEVRHGTEVALDVLNDLLQYDKIEIGKLKLEVDEVDLWKVVQDNVSMFAAQAVKSGVVVEMENSLTDSRVSQTDKDMILSLRLRGDCIRIAQAIRNLVSNALKFSPEGGKIAISLQWLPTGLPLAQVPDLDSGCAAYGSPLVRRGSVLFQVKDEGPGMSSQELSDLFGEGVQFRANKLQAGAGSGLGLYISKSIVEMHGGRVWASSSGIGCGSTFSLELPLCQVGQSLETFDEEAAHGVQPKSKRARDYLLACDTAYSPFHTAENEKKRASQDPSEYIELLELGVHAPPQQNEPHRIATSTEQLTARLKHVLVVDDAPTNRKMLCRLMTRWGYTCSTAEDGLECLRCLELQDFDIIMMDFQMPMMTGPEATQRIRELYSHRNYIIIGVTGNIMPEDQKIFLDAGANAVLRKPLDFDTFKEVLEQVSGKSSSGKYTSLK